VDRENEKERERERERGRQAGSLRHRERGKTGEEGEKGLQ